MKTNYEIDGMTCDGCLKNVRWAFLQLSEVQKVDVQLHPPGAAITTSKPFAIHELQAHLTKAGPYTIRELVSKRSTT